MNEPKETPIFPMSVEPVREGVYKLHLQEYLDPPSERFSLWKNGRWHAWQHIKDKDRAATVTVRSALAYESFYTKGWSGLAEPSHD